MIEHSNTSKFGDGDGGWHRKGKSGELVRNPVLFLTVVANASARMAEDRKRKCKPIGFFFVTCLNFRTVLDCISTYANPQPELALLARACRRRRRLLLLRVSCSPFAASCRDAPWRSALLPPSARRPSPSWTIVIRNYLIAHSTNPCPGWTQVLGTNTLRAYGFFRAQPST